MCCDETSWGMGGIIGDGIASIRRQKICRVIKFSSLTVSRFSLLAALPPSRFGEPPLPALPLPLSSGDEELFSPGINDMSPNCCGDVSPTFEKPNYREMEKTMEASRFVAQHVKNKDKFESVSIRRCLH